MAVLPQLVEPSTYRPCGWDLKRDAEGRTYWVNVFRQHLELLSVLIAEEYPQANGRPIEAFRHDYLAAMRVAEREPERFETLDVLRFTELRRDVQVRHGFNDPFRGLKQRENAAALAILPSLLAELDALPPESQLETLVKGLMAGNLFDLGSLPTIDRYRNGEVDFRQARANLPRRPWFIDELEDWQRRWQEGPGYRHVLFFVDNAGSDICLGCLPLVRWMIRAGARVTLAANSGPALNDVTAAELAGIISQVTYIKQLKSKPPPLARLSVTGSGSSLPLLDLTALGPNLVQAAHDADLIILHGMGRAIESNFETRLRCDAVWCAVLKDPAVAQHVGGRLFDCVLRYRPGTPADDANSGKQQPG